MTITSFCLFHSPCKWGHVSARDTCWIYKLKYSDNQITKTSRVRRKLSFFLWTIFCCKILSLCLARDCKDVGPNWRLPADVAVPTKSLWFRHNQAKRMCMWILLNLFVEVVKWYWEKSFLGWCVPHLCRGKGEKFLSRSSCTTAVLQVQVLLSVSGVLWKA